MIIYKRHHQHDVTQSALSERKNNKYCLIKTTTIVNVTSYFPRKYREAVEIQKHNPNNHPNNLNRDNSYNIHFFFRNHV